MYIIAGVVGILFILMTLVSTKKNPPIERKGIWKTLDRISVLILELYQSLYGRLHRNIQLTNMATMGTDVSSYLEQLNPGAELKKLREDYIIRKLSLSILIVLMGTVVGVAVKYTSGQNTLSINAEGGVRREEFFGEKKDVSVRALIDGYESEIHFRLNPRKLTDDELEDIIPEFREKLGNVLKADNFTLSEVNSKINPAIKVEGYPFSIRWSSSDYGLVSPTGGEVSEVEEECQVFMTAHIKYEGEAWDEEYVLTLVPLSYSEEEELGAGLSKEIIKSEEQQREDEIMILPKEYDGKSVTWMSVANDNSLFIWAAVIIVAIVVFFLTDKDLGKKVDDKKASMKREYSEIVRKIALYVGAGMTVRSSFQKIAIDATEKSAANPIYMEMIFTCRELKSGVSEEEAYERFGRRTGIQQYIQLSTLLQQNIKRGSANLLGRLREEADNAAIERLQTCRKRGEEASTKLLVPMVLMLLVVMVIIMLPAFSSMNL